MSGSHETESSAEEAAAGERSDSTRQLADFVALISSLEDETAAVRRAVERIAEEFDAEGAAIVRDGTTVADAGFDLSQLSAGDLAELAERGSIQVKIGGAGTCHVTAASIEGESLRLIVARAGTEFDRADRQLLSGMAGALWLGLRTLRLLGEGSAPTRQPDVDAVENERLLTALRQRQALLERLSRLQRAIVDRRPPSEILGLVAEGLHEIVGRDVVGLRLRDHDDHAHTLLVASIGSDDELQATMTRASASEGLGGRAMRERGLVVADAVSGVHPAELAVDFSAGDVASAIAAPLWERGEIAGSLAIGSRSPDAEFDAREQQVLLAFAEHASLALGHERSVADALREAFRDLLTGLPNRALFMDRLEVALARARGTSEPVSVLLCDLDGFKTVNDSLGLQAGDRLLVAVAERLRGCLRPTDTMARLGGDEFAVLMEETSDPGEGPRAAQRMLDALQAPFKLAGREIVVSASIGIAAATDNPDTLLRDADLAMYRAKSLGKGRFAAFEPQMHTAVIERLELEVDLNRAVERGELVLAYQPIFELRSGALRGFEALLRWRHPTRGLLLPDRFIPLAEESGQIRPLGRWALGSAAQQAALWRARYPAIEGLQVGVNLSASQLREAVLVSEVEDALAAAQLDADGLILEITESSLMEDTEACARRLSDLKQLGVEIAIDDFGTGYSSLTYLRRFPLDHLKIDRSFVHEITASGLEPALLRAIIDLTEAFGLTAIAEGIERPEQRRRLIELGCELGQGNVLSPPLSAAEADALLLNAGLLGGPVSVELPDSQSRVEPPA